MKQKSRDWTWIHKHSSFPVSSSLKNETITSPFKLSLSPRSRRCWVESFVRSRFWTFISSTYILFLHLAHKLVTTSKSVNELKLGGHVSSLWWSFWSQATNFQAGGIPSLVFVLSRARKYMRMQPGKLYLFFGPVRIHKPMEKKPPGVIFKLFLDSLNMKSLSSDLSSFHAR